MHRVPKEMMGMWVSLGPWVYQGLKGFQVPREILVYLVLLESSVLLGSPVRVESLGSQESRARGARSERQDSQGQRDPKALLAGPEKMGLQDTREKPVDLETEAPKVNVATQVFPGKEEFRESEDVLVMRAHLDRVDLQAKKVTQALPDSWKPYISWVILASWRN